jgi:hypothetical protein
VFEMEAPIQNPAKCGCVPSYDFSKQKVNVQRKFTKKFFAVCGNVMNRQNVTKWCRELCEGSSMMMRMCKKKS